MKTWKIILVIVSTTMLIAPLTAYATVSMFADVPDNHIFVEDINWMKTARVTQGCGDGTNYCPDANVTRGQMAAFMHRLAINRVVDAGTLDGRDSNDYFYDAEWVLGEKVFSLAPGQSTGVTVNCPKPKDVVSGGGMIYQGGGQLMMTESRRNTANDPGWTVSWTNTGTAIATGTARVEALCEGREWVALP